jgi:hypothetical protein
MQNVLENEFERKPAPQSKSGTMRNAEHYTLFTEYLLSVTAVQYGVGRTAVVCVRILP